MPDEIYLEEILQRDRDDYDPYEYIEEENLRTGKRPRD